MWPVAGGRAMHTFRLPATDRLAMHTFRLPATDRPAMHIGCITAVREKPAAARDSQA